MSSACNDSSSVGERNEPVDVFYAGDQAALNLSTPSRLISGGFSEEPFTFHLRPLGITLAIPKNRLAYVSHSYQPYAKQIWDKAVIVAMLPDFVPRNAANAQLLSTNSSGDNITVAFGWLSGEYEQSAIEEAVAKGKLKEAPLEATKDVRVFRRTTYGNTGVFWVKADPKKFRSPMGNEISFVCGTSAPPDSSQKDRCRVTLALPPSEFEGVNPHEFGGVPGVQLEYFFSQKYLSRWAHIHEEVLELVRSFRARPAQR